MRGRFVHPSITIGECWKLRDILLSIQRHCACDGWISVFLLKMPRFRCRSEVRSINLPANFACTCVLPRRPSCSDQTRNTQPIPWWTNVARSIKVSTLAITTPFMLNPMARPRTLTFLSFSHFYWSTDRTIHNNTLLTEHQTIQSTRGNFTPYLVLIQFCTAAQTRHRWFFEWRFEGLFKDI